MASLSAGTVSLGVRPDATGFGSKLSESIMGEAGSLRGVGKHLGGLIMGGLAAVSIATGIGEIVKKGVEEYSKADALNAQFTAGIKSTGNAAGLTVKGMDELANSISGYSGQTYDSIGKTEQLLQTFTNIKNVGPNKIFDDATTAAANMAAKMGGDASAQAIQLGIALNDPTKGIARLHRVGVAFTQGQTDSIKAMQASGNLMGAQKIILAELATEFGGAAKAAGQTLPGEIARSKVAFGELTKAIMTGVMPFVTPVIEGIANAMIKLTPHVEHVSEVMREKLAPVVKIISAAFTEFIGGFTKGTDALGSSQSMFAVWGAVAFGVVNSVKSVFEKLWPTIAPLIPQVLGLVTALSPIHLIFEAIAPILPGLVTSLVGLGATLAGALGGALKVIIPVLVTLVAVLAGQFMGIVKMLIPIIVHLVEVMGPILSTVIKALAPIIVMLVTFIGQLLKMIMPLIPVVLSLVVAFMPIVDIFIQLVSALLPPIISLLMAILPPVMSFVTALVSFLVPVLQIVIAVLTWLITNVIAGFKIELGFVIGVVTAVGSTIGSVFGAIGAVIKGAFNGVVSFVKGIFNTIIGLVNGIIDGINGATSLGGAIGLNITALPHLPKLADGATILPRAGGTPVILGEAGKAESVVDTGKLNKRLDEDGAGGQTFNVYEAVSAYATAMQVSRIQNARRA
jgi:phage-related protein